MSEDFDDSEDIKDLFKKILGSEVIIKDNIDATEKSVFLILIKKLEQSNEIENLIFEHGGFELTKVTDPLWFVIENTFKFLYGEEVAELVFWYVFDRFNPDGSIVPLEDEDGKQYTFKNANDLWSYIKYYMNPLDPEQ